MGTRVKVIDSRTMTASRNNTFGPKILDRAGFYRELEKAVAGVEWPKDFAIIILPPNVANMVSAGVGRRSPHPEDYVVRRYEGRVGLYLKRSKAARPNLVTATVYTRHAYLTELAELGIDENIEDATHVLTDVVTHTDGPNWPLDPLRFAIRFAQNQFISEDSAKRQATKILELDSKWSLVAD